MALERELGISHVLAQVLVRRGLDDPQRARAFLDPGGDPRPAARSRGSRPRRRLIERHIAARGPGSSSTATTTSTASAPPRSWSARCARSARTRAGSCPTGSKTATASPRRRSARLAERGNRPADHRRLRDHRRRRGRRGARGGDRRGRHRPPRAARRRPAPRLPDRAPRGLRLSVPPICAAPASPTSSPRRSARPTADEDLELVALATVADLMPLQGENRRLVREGLAALANTARPGLRALMTVSRVDPSALDAGALGFRLAPRINAAGRLRRRRRRARAAAHRATPSGRGRSRSSSTRSTPSAARSSSGSAGRPRRRSPSSGERSAYVLAAEDWHPGRDRDRRLADRRAPSPARDPDRDRRGRPRPRLGAQHPRLRPARRPARRRRAPGALRRPPRGGRAHASSRDRIDALRAAFEAHAAPVLTPELLAPRRAGRCGRLGRRARARPRRGARAARAVRHGQSRAAAARARRPVRRRRGRWGRGATLRFSVSSGRRARARGGLRLRRAPRGRVGGSPSTPPSGSSATCGTAPSSRGSCSARPGVRPGSDRGRRRASRLSSPPCSSELDAPRPSAARPPDTRAGHGLLLDRRGESPLAVLADACAAGGAVLAVCADVPRRLGGWPRGPAASRWSATTPSSGPGAGRRLYPRRRARPASRAPMPSDCSVPVPVSPIWPGARLSYALRSRCTSWSTVFALRSPPSTGASGSGRGWPVRSSSACSAVTVRMVARPRVAARLIRVLAELELVSLDRDLPALAMAGETRTALERSPAYRAYTTRYEDGRRYLSSAKPPPSS